MPTIITSFIASIQKKMGIGQTYNPYGSYNTHTSTAGYARPSSWKTYGTYTGHTGIMQTIRQSFATSQRKVYIGGGIAGILAIYILWIYGFVVQELPDLTMEGLQRLNFSQTSTITDKNDKVLYKFYEENREFVDYSAINPMMVNAIVSIEDQTFWTNAGVDFKGILRAFYSTIKGVILGRSDAQGASTITQQLLKNILSLNKNESGMYDKIKRKHKERLLVSRLSKVFEDDILSKYPTISTDELMRKKKEKIMELYLNYIYLGNQTYGIQAASKAYFARDAKDLSIVQSAIIASMPQAPTTYNPYKYPIRVIGKLHISDAQGTTYSSGVIYTKIVSYIQSAITTSTSPIAKGNNTFSKFLSDTIPSTINIDGMIYTISYESGRKDAVLNRMYEDNYIDQPQLIQAFMEGLTLTLQSEKISLQAPHFVFWVKDLLRKDPTLQALNITDEMLYQGGLTIKSTLDLDIQEIAQKAIDDNMQILYDRGGNNRAMVYIDSRSGDVLAYVGSADYYNEKIDGKVDILTTSDKQPGSSIKPFIYAYGLQTLPITIDSPIYDIPLSIGGNTPSNADGKFEGLLPLRQALAHSRNIPSIKMYLAAGKEEEMKPFLQSVGMKALKNSNSYGYSIALGAGEIPPLQLAQAYSFMSRKGKAPIINPILSIKGADGQLLYQKKVIPIESGLAPGAAYLIREILSNTFNMPPGRVGYYTIPKFKYAVKSGTSNVKVGDKSLPRDGWLATYTPSAVAIYRAGNTKPTAMKPTALGLLLNSEVNKTFYSQLLKKGYLRSEEMEPSPVSRLTISKITGRLPAVNTPEDFLVSTLAFSKNIASDTPDTYKEFFVDTSCGALASPLTPEDQKRFGYNMMPLSITPYDIDAIRTWYTPKTGMVVPPYNIYMTKPATYCPGRETTTTDDITLTTSLTDNIQIQKNLTLSYTASLSGGTIKKIAIRLGDRLLSQSTYTLDIVNDTKTIKLPGSIGTGNNVVYITAIDDQNRSKEISIKVKVE